MDVVQDGFDSSDLEFPSDGEQQPYPRPGQASIERIIASAAEDRVSSKKTLKNLQLHSRAPGTEGEYSLWIARFNAFREHTLRQSLDTPFTGADMIRFFDCMIGRPPLLLLPRLPPPLFPIQPTPFSQGLYPSPFSRTAASSQRRPWQVTTGPI